MPGRGATAAAPPGASRATPVPPRADASLGLALRVPAFVAVTTVLGVGGHVATDGAVPHPRLLLLAVVVVWLVALVVRGRELRAPGMVALLVATQAALHAVLALCHCGPGLLGAAVHRVLCPVPASPWADDPLLVAPVHHHATSAGGYLAHLYPGHAMVVAHLVAALVAGWWLSRGEAAVWRAARTVVPLLRSLAVVPAPAVDVPVAPRPSEAAVTLLVPLRDQVLARLVNPHRGPPPVFA